MKQEKIPILDLLEKERQFFETSIEWRPMFYISHRSFHINRIEDYLQYLKLPFPPHRQTEYDFIFLTQGTSVRSKGLDSFEFGANSFFFLPPYQITTHESMSKDAKGFYCHFNPEILNRHFLHLHNIEEFSFLQFIGNPVIQVSPATTPTLLHILYRLEKEYQKSAQVNFDLVGAYLLALLLEVKEFSNINKITENAAFRITQQYKNALTQHIYELQTVTAYADKLAVSPNHLNKSVKTATGKSAQDILNEMIVLEAKAMLKQTSLDIASIAYKMGKENPGDFTRFFKLKTGFTPSQYKGMD